MGFFLAAAELLVGGTASATCILAQGRATDGRGSDTASAGPSAEEEERERKEHFSENPLEF